LAYVVSSTLELDHGGKGKKVISAVTDFAEAINGCDIDRAVGQELMQV
jgi:hypothetical protein